MGTITDFWRPARALSVHPHSAALASQCSLAADATQCEQASRKWTPELVRSAHGKGLTRLIQVCRASRHAVLCHGSVPAALCCQGPDIVQHSLVVAKLVEVTGALVGGVDIGERKCPHPELLCVERASSLSLSAANVRTHLLLDWKYSPWRGFGPIARIIILAHMTARKSARPVLLTQLIRCS